MLIHDRVICDFCNCAIGQLFGLRAGGEFLPDMRFAPYFAICPVCKEKIYSEFEGS